MKRRFYTLDVFTNQPYAGNPLAVVLDCEGLDTAQMLAITRDFNLAETVFVETPKDPINTAKIRIFCVTHEMPFAGHPTVGTAILLAMTRASNMLGGAGGLRLILEEKVGPVACDVLRLQSGELRAVFSAPVVSKRQQREFDPDLVARAIGVTVADLNFDRHVVSLWNGGLPYVLVPLKSLDALAKAGIADQTLWQQAFGPVGETAASFASLYVYARADANGPHDVRARMFMPGMGMPEDPATGSAVAAFAGAAVAFEQPGDGTHQLIIGQGYEMGRPSDIALDVDVVGGQLVAARIGGSAVIMSEGTLHH
jgi:trans-2,3-dihydro-3-hydroxyanthranilate isomerase